MIKYIIVLIFVCEFSHAQITNPAPYCNSTYTSTSMYPEISKVEISGMNGFSNTSVHTPAPAYTFYNNLPLTNLIFGNPFNVKITLKNVDMETMLKGWIDYNNNQIFESSELIISVPQGSVGTGMAVVKQATFSIPVSSCGFCQVRMRFSLGWHYANWGSQTFRLDSCNTAVTGDGSAGETEDYVVGIIFPSQVQEISQAKSSPLYPNPATNKINLKNFDSTYELEIYNYQGKLISTLEQISERNNELDISDLKSGIYFIRTKNINSTQTYKFIKE